MSRYFMGSPSQAFLAQQHKGRTKGTPNKHTAVYRWGLVEAYRQLGGVDGLVKWGKKHPTEFYQLCGKLIPAEVADQHGTGPQRLQVVILPAQSLPNQVPSNPKHIPAPDEVGGRSPQPGVAVEDSEA